MKRPGFLAWAFTLLFPFAQIRIKNHRPVCPVCGAPPEDLMYHSNLCYRCYWWAMFIFYPNERWVSE